MPGSAAVHLHTRRRLDLDRDALEGRPRIHEQGEQDRRSIVAATMSDLVEDATHGPLRAGFRKVLLGPDGNASVEVAAGQLAGIDGFMGHAISVALCVLVVTQ
jgi:hypothetical protein